MLMGEVRAEGLWRAIDPTVRDGLTNEQEAAIRDAARHDPWQQHSVDIRLGLPSPFGRLYVTLVGGREKRNWMRRVIERERHPLSSVANLVVFAGLLATTGLAGVGVYFLIVGA